MKIANALYRADAIDKAAAAQGLNNGWREDAEWIKLPEWVDTLQFCDADIAEAFGSEKAYKLDWPLMVQLFREIRLLREAISELK